MIWYVHLLWAAVVFLASIQIRGGLASAGEWIARALMKNTETLAALERERQARSKR